LLAFEDDPAAFELDANDPLAVRAASFILGVNGMAMRLDEARRRRLASRVIGDLAPDRDIRHLEFMIIAFHHLGAKGLTFRMANVEGLGNFDFRVEVGGRDVGAVCSKRCRVSLPNTKEAHATRAH
jgi:hypothetical protein